MYEYLEDRWLSNTIVPYIENYMLTNTELNYEPKQVTFRNKELEEKGSATYKLNYYGYNVGQLYKNKSDKILSIYFEACESETSCNVRADYPDIPFSINGLTIGTTSSEIKEIMGED